jgi:exodeoxyribonuclease VII small subunit
VTEPVDNQPVKTQPVDTRPVDAESVGYAEAVAELDRILSELEDPAIDVDQLAARVRRAAELIELCRSRIAKARMDVEQVVTALDETYPARADSE